MAIDPEQLARNFQDGDAPAFADLIDAYQERFYRVAYRILGDADAALDVVQDAFVKIHRSIEQWDAASKFSSWAFRVVTNLAIDRIRRSTRERKAWEHRAQEEPAYLDDTTDAGLVAQDRKRLVEEIKLAIEDLPPGQRTVVALRHYEGFSLKEIAEIRGCAVGTVKSTLHQAFRSLRNSLGPQALSRASAIQGVA
ncbi:MAG: RNA polymerase sigma factor [Planctomycetota bacterium]